MAEIKEGSVKIKELIPQREPIIMLDAFYGATESEADTGLVVSNDNLFCNDGIFMEPGLVEHIAQSASAFAGYKAKAANKPAPVGYIAEVKGFRIHFLPHAGDCLRTHIRIISEVLGVSLLTAETKVEEEVVARCQMKIFIKPS
ncbi:MAG: hydroxymyristoyl-ACP dehydratase [Tannerella sp.]|jgi:3-hydroxymyristoyl/3-hydroxydecanoyl-(acyl carrier protein) dehydratase|nr:hydroxymyristoyl-ACP dehydratase [Tannerella sp.]